MLLLCCFAAEIIIHDDFVFGNSSLITPSTIVIFLPLVLSSPFSFLCFSLFWPLAYPVLTARLVRSIHHHSCSQNARPSSRSQDAAKHIITPYSARRLAISPFPLSSSDTMELVAIAANSTSQNPHTPSILDSRQDPNETSGYSR